MISYGQRLVAALRQRGPLCVGIDPHPIVLASWDLPLNPTSLEQCTRGLVEALGELRP